MKRSKYKFRIGDKVETQLGEKGEVIARFRERFRERNNEAYVVEIDTDLSVSTKVYGSYPYNKTNRFVFADFFLKKSLPNS